jgi:hypothetical protein
MLVKRCGTPSVRASLVPSLKRNRVGISSMKRFDSLAPSVPEIFGHGRWHRKPVTGSRPFRGNHDSAPRQTSPAAIIPGRILSVRSILCFRRATTLVWSYQLYRRTPSHRNGVAAQCDFLRRLDISVARKFARGPVVAMTLSGQKTLNVSQASTFEYQRPMTLIGMVPPRQMS